MSIYCGPDNQCPLLYQCIDNKICKHNPIFPISTYQYIIFSLFPICSAICNVSGNSFGEFKVILLMDLLNYQENQATTIAYPLIVGTALYNFFDLILKRHPTKNTSLIDYNIVLIIIPNILFGSTLGSLVNKFIPPIVADSIILPIFIGFSIKFFLRLRNYLRLAKQQQERKQVQLFSSSNDTQQGRQQLKAQLMLKKIHSEKVSGIYKGTKSQIKKKNKKQLSQETQKQSLPNQQMQQKWLTIKKQQNQTQLRKLERYQAGLHIPHILVTILIFLVFQTLSFLVQGKIIPFTICTDYYKIGISILTVLFLLFDFGMFLYTKRRMNYYKQIGYRYDAKISIPKYYLMICIGAFLGGFNGGVFGIGNSTTVIFTLLFLDLQPVVVSATVGYQVVFSGSASLAQAFVTNQIPGNVALLFFLITFVIGGIFSFFAKKFVSQFNAIKVNVAITLVIFCLVTLNIFALIAAIILGYWQFGKNNMEDVPFHC